MDEAFPRYTIPPSVLTDLAVQVILRRQKGFRVHACRMVASLRREPLILGTENIPRCGPALIIANHYQRPGFFIPWLAALISAQVGQEICWVMTGAWTFPNTRIGSLFEWVSRWVFHRVAAVYGFITMPPIPPRPQDAAERAAAVTRLLRLARNNPGVLIGLTPEGGDSTDGTLALPPKGSGRFMLALSAMGMRIHPVGFYELEGRLVVRFGPPFLLEVNCEDRSEADRLARLIVMEQLAACLPDQLCGEFARTGSVLAGTAC